MNRLMMTSVAVAFSLLVSQAEAGECSQTCRGTPARVPQPTPGIPMQRIPGNASNNSNNGDDIDWDLPNDPNSTPKQRVNGARPAVAQRATPRPAGSPTSPIRSPEAAPPSAGVSPNNDNGANGRGAAQVATSPTLPAGQTYNERVAKAVALQQTLLTQNAKLSRKRTELERWEAADQEKFRQVFGTTDDDTRIRVVKRIDQLMERNAQVIADISDSLNLEFYLQSKKGATATASRQGK